VNVCDKPEYRPKSWYTETSEVTVHQIQEMLGTIGSQYFACNQKNVTVQKLILFYCCMGMKLALPFCETVKWNKLLQSYMQTVTTIQMWCQHPHLKTSCMWRLLCASYCVKRTLFWVTTQRDNALPMNCVCHRSSSGVCHRSHISSLLHDLWLLASANPRHRIIGSPFGFGTLVLLVCRM